MMRASVQRGAMVEATRSLSGERTAPADASGHVEITVQPPIPFVTEDASHRQARLADLAAREVIPRLLALHSDILAPMDADSPNMG